MTSDSKYTMRAKLYLFGVSSLLSFLLAEIVVRCFYENPFASRSQNYVTDIYLHPANLNYPMDRRKAVKEPPEFVKLRTDHRSYIQPSFQFDSPDITIAFQGGSTTECEIVQESHRFHSRVSDLISERGIKTNTLNSSKGGNTIHDSLNVFLSHIVQDRPDIAVVMHAVNDAGVLRSAGSYAFRAARHRSVKDTIMWTGQHVSARSAVVALARDVVRRAAIFSDPHKEWRLDRQVADGIPADEFKMRLVAYVRVCQSFRVEPVLMTQPLSGAFNKLTPDWADLGVQDRMNAIIRDVGQKENVVVIDLANQFANSNDLFYDGMHVTDEGSEAYAKFIAEQLMEHCIQKRFAMSGTAVR